MRMRGGWKEQEREVKLGEEGGGREKGTLGKLVKNDQEIKEQVFPKFLSAATAYFTFSNDGRYPLYSDHQVTQ